LSWIFKIFKVLRKKLKIDSIPAVSIIIPAYNAEAFIKETIHSVLDQSFSNFEVIVVDDGSKDQTIEILEQIQDPRLRVYSYANGGVAVARNRGISHSTGELISFLDADDLWTTDKLEKQLNALETHPEAGVAYSWTQFIDLEARPLYAQEPVFFEDNVYAQILVSNFTANGSNMLIRRQFVEAIGGFDHDVRPAEDWDYAIRLAAVCPFVLVPQYQILYRQTFQSQSSKIDVMEKSSLAIIEKAYQAAPVELRPLKSKSLGNTYRYLTKTCLLHTHNDRDIEYASEKLWKAIQCYPKFLFSLEMQRIIFEVLLARIFSYKISIKLMQLLSRSLPIFSNKFLLLMNHD
jgi:glycosyltransferase involved in cell wall biosynthesis